MYRSAIPLMAAASRLLAAALLTACSDGSDSFVDAPPSSLTINTVASPEGMAGEMTRLVFRATMTDPQPGPVTLNYQTAPGTASAGIDYLETGGSVEIPAGALTAEIAVEVFGGQRDCHRQQRHGLYCQRRYRLRGAVPENRPQPLADSTGRGPPELRPPGRCDRFPREYAVRLQRGGEAR